MLVNAKQLEQKIDQYYHKIITKYEDNADIPEKNIDVMEICVIILCSARKIPDQSYNAQYGLEGRLGVRVCQM